MDYSICKILSKIHEKQNFFFKSAAALSLRNSLLQVLITYIVTDNTLASIFMPQKRDYW